MSNEIEVRITDRYVSVEGPFINSLGENLDPVIQTDQIENRVRRDGHEHHITLVNPIELSKICSKMCDKEMTKSQRKKLFGKQLSKVYSDIVDEFGHGSQWERPVDMGLGICREGKAVSYFRVIHWPFGQKVRQYLQLPPANFHITLGFSPKDVHLYKGPGSLLCLEQSQVCDSITMAQLITFVDIYAEDTVFIRKLFEACWRNGLYAECTQLGKVCATNMLSKFANYFSNNDK